VLYTYNQMDVVSQTSFIPKKPIMQAPQAQASRGMSLFLLVSVFLFSGSLLLAAGVYVWKGALERGIESQKESLARNRDAFEPASIIKLQRLSRRLEISKTILANHLAPSQLFAVLEESTLQNVRFSSMDFALDQTKGTAILTMKGQARSYGAVARQSDVFAKASGIKNPVFSELNLDQRGNVVFSFTAAVDPSSLRYSSLLNSRVAAPVQTESPSSSEE